MRSARTVRDLGLIEAELSSVFVKYAGDVQSGVLEPTKIDAGLVRKITRLSAADHLDGLVSSDGGTYFDSLAPQSMQYRALLKQKKTLEHLLDDGGWGETVPVAKYEVGDTGTGVIKLRNGEYSSLSLHMDIAEVLELRAAIIRHTAEVFAPDLMIVDKERT